MAKNTIKVVRKQKRTKQKYTSRVAEQQKRRLQYRKHRSSLDSAGFTRWVHT